MTDADDRPVMSESELRAAIAAVGRWFEQHPNYAEDAEAETEAAWTADELRESKERAARLVARIEAGEVKIANSARKPHSANDPDMDALVEWQRKNMPDVDGDELERAYAQYVDEHRKEAAERRLRRSIERLEADPRQVELKRIYDMIVKLTSDFACTVADCGEPDVEPVRTGWDFYHRLNRILDSFSRKPESKYTFARDRGLEEPSHTFVGTDAAAAKLDELRARPGAAERVAEIRAEMDAADRRDQS